MNKIFMGLDRSKSMITSKYGILRFAYNFLTDPLLIRNSAFGHFFNLTGNIFRVWPDQYRLPTHPVILLFIKSKEAEYTKYRSITPQIFTIISPIFFFTPCARLR